MKKVLILGGGFAGVQTAIDLQKKKQFDVTLISDRDFLFLYPVSIWVPVRSKSFDQVKIDLTKISRKHGFSVMVDQVTGIQAAENKVILAHGELTYETIW